MGSYLYRAFGKSFPVKVDGVDTPARLCKYWCKPHWELFDCALAGHAMSYWGDWERRTWRGYVLQLGKINSVEGTMILVHNNNPDLIDNYKKPAEGDVVLIFKRPKRIVWDDPNWEGATIRKLHKGPAGWEAVP